MPISTVERRSRSWQRPFLAFAPALGLLLACSQHAAPNRVTKPDEAFENPVKRSSEAVESVPKEHPKTIENSLRMKLNYIPAGEFEMGSPGVGRVNARDGKSHHVRLTKGFYMGAHEVTQDEFEQVMGRNPSWFRRDGGGKKAVSGQETGSFPVEGVTWYDAVKFCNVLSKGEGRPEYYTLQWVIHKGGAITKAVVTENGGRGYRLPTEAEWEYACRAGTTTTFHFGDVLNGKEANVNSNLERTAEVASYSANAFGMYDMHGNVWEWCNDWYGDYTGDVVDPIGPESGDSRVYRGGAWSIGAKYCSSSERSYGFPSGESHNLGFRVACTP